ncbi:hypothetical protein D9M71_830030 [compost metagenome]
MPSHQARAALYSFQQAVFLGGSQGLGGHRVVPADHDQVVAGQVAVQGENVGGLLDLEVELLEQLASPGCDLIGEMAGPAAIQVKDTGHG